MRPRYPPRGPHPLPQGMRPMGMPNGMRPPMRGRGGPMHRGMGPRPPPFPGMRPPLMYPPMGPPGPGPMMPRMRPPPPPHMLPPHMRPRMMPRPMKKPMKNMNHDGKIKKKKLKFRSFYITRPWVNDELKREISKKDDLFQQAKNSNKAEDWNLFKEQKDKCVHMYSALKMEYIGQHPEEVFSDSGSEDEDASEFVCEPCDREFSTLDDYNAHLTEHQTCGIDGCKFTAHELLMMTHIKMQHSSGLYEKIGNISTPEDIEKWRLERKKNYPTKNNIELRYKLQEEMMKRGERIQPKKERFPKRDKREPRRAKKRTKPVATETPKNAKQSCLSLIDEKADWNGTMFPFKGTSQLEDAVETPQQSYSDDEEWSPTLPQPEIKLNNALGALMGAYDSEDSDLEAESSKTENIKKPDVSIVETNTRDQTNDDDVVEEKILKVPVDIPDRASVKRTKVLNAEDESSPQVNTTRPKKNKKLPPPKLKPISRRPTLLEKLLDNEIRHERNVILQCVRYVVNNNFFRTQESE